MASRPIAKADAFGPGRFGVRVFLLVLAMLIAVPLHLIWDLLRLRSPWPRMFLAAVGRICGGVVEAHGTRLRRDVFYAANHLGWVEDPILGGLTGAAFIAQDEIAKWPLIGWLATMNNTIFVSRTARFTVGGQIDVIRRALEAHQPIVVYPEGTTTDGRSLLPFKPSLFQVMCPPPRPMMVQPLFLDFGEAGPEIAWVGDEQISSNAWRLLSRKGTFRLRVEFLEPFDPVAVGDRKAVAAEAHRRVAEALSRSLARTAIASPPG